MMVNLSLAIAVTNNRPLCYLATHAATADIRCANTAASNRWAKQATIAPRQRSRARNTTGTRLTRNSFATVAPQTLNEPR